MCKSNERWELETKATKKPERAQDREWEWGRDKGQKDNAKGEKESADES